MSSREGNIESKTFGIVSPTITQKATMPPKALYAVNTCASRYDRIDVQEPLREGYSHEPGFPKAVLYRRLERIRPAELRVYDNESNCPVYDDCEADEQSGSCQQAGIADSVRLANDTSPSTPD